MRTQAPVQDALPGPAAQINQHRPGFKGQGTLSKAEEIAVTILSVFLHCSDAVVPKGQFPERIKRVDHDQFGIQKMNLLHFDSVGLGS